MVAVEYDMSCLACLSNESMLFALVEPSVVTMK